MELWTLVDKTSGNPIVPMDRNPECDDQGLLVYRSCGAARRAAKYQNYHFDVDCKARRLDKIDEF